MDKKITQKLNEQYLDGIKYKIKDNWVYVKRPGKVWSPIDQALYYAMRDIIRAGY